MNSFIRLTIVTTLCALGFLTQSCSSSKTVELTDLSGYWTLKTLKGEPAIEAFKGSIPSLEFNLESKQIQGSGGCNRFNGAFTLEGSTFKAPKLASTMKLCMEANKEDLFTSTLSHEDGLTLTLEKGILTFKDKDAVVLEFQKGDAPNSKAKAVTATNLVGTWTLSKIKGDDAVSLFGTEPATLVYTEGGAISGNAGCNNYRSNATIENGTITFGPMMATKMACPHLEGEQIYSTILSQPVDATISGDRLIFSQNGEVVLEFLKDLE